MSLTALQKVVKVLKIVGGDHTVKMFIFTRFLKGFGLLVQRPCYWCSAPFGAGMLEMHVFPMFFEGSQGQPVRLCGMLDFTCGLMGKLI